MRYIFLLTWLIVIWLGSAWTEGLIGAWGMWTSLSIASAWFVAVCAAKILGKGRYRNGKEGA